ncbi:Glutamyl-tRNA amidotransferase A subunit [Neoconidiobolus thromboides FSU 785]|nr:Glutamyl-tRNA amidotransferase A subunit [Neoconidiobolus thromboides FSU 785]
MKSISKSTLILQSMLRRHSTLTSTSRKHLSLTDLQSWNKHYNAFTSINTAETSFITDRLENDFSFDLNGLAIAIKDNICTKGYPTTCGSLMLKDFIPTYNATVIEKLLNHNVKIIGKTNMDEFGMGSNNQTSYFGQVVNPHPSYTTNTHSPGGSSGGSAAAVKSGMCYAALGSDTGGSVRLPASYCGIIGFKPSYGMISRYGLIPYASSLDTIGVMGRSVNSVKNIFEVIKGQDQRDQSSIDYSKKEKKENKKLKDIVIGIPNQYYLKEIDEEVNFAWDKSIQLLQDNGVKVINIDLKHTKYALSAYYIIALAEASSNLAKYDGVEFGYCQEDMEGSFDQKIRHNREIGFNDEVKKRIILGTHILSKGSFEAYFKKAQKIRTLVVNDFNSAFLNCDLILSPTAFSKAPSIKDLSTALPAYSYLNDVFTTPSSLAGLPAISVPFSNSNKMGPIGLQLVGQRGNDKQVLNAAEEFCQLLYN